MLGWRQRFRVALGTAGALQFLHTVKEKPLIHGDVKRQAIITQCTVLLYQHKPDCTIPSIVSMIGDWPETIEQG